MVNIGQRIQEELDRQERTVSWMARKMNCSRNGIYRILKKNSIDTALLGQICHVLHYNFFEELSENVMNEEK
jgi:DNA-binding phage protein